MIIFNTVVALFRLFWHTQALISIRETLISFGFYERTTPEEYISTAILWKQLPRWSFVEISQVNSEEVYNKIS